MASVASIHRYPVKSCRGIALEKALVQRRGFALDRRLMIVDGTGRFRSQRTDPRLAQVVVDVEDEDDLLVLGTDAHGEFHLTLGDLAEGEVTEVSVWSHTGPAVDQGDDAAEFVSDIVGATSRLVYMADEMRRPVDPEHAAGPEDIVGFADGYPLLLTNAASLAQLQTHMDELVPMERFRPNIVLEHDEAWAEDAWRELVIGATRFTVAKACTRCAITTTDQLTGERFAEPLRTLGARRRTPDGVTFGVYLIPLDIGATIAVGDEVTQVE